MVPGFRHVGMVGRRQSRILVQRQCLGLRKVLFGGPIDGVRRKKGDRQQKGFVGGSLSQKNEGILLIPINGVHGRTTTFVGIGIPVLSRVYSGKIKVGPHVLLKTLKLPLANVSDMIATLMTQQSGKTLVRPVLVEPRILWQTRLVPTQVLSRKQRGATDPTDTRGDHVVGKANTGLGQRVEKGCLGNSVATMVLGLVGGGRHAQGIESPVIGIEQ